MKNGGPAFPRVTAWKKSSITSGIYREFESTKGMSLRDYYAAKAMQGLISESSHTNGKLAEIAYRVADAMLEAREQ